MPDLYFIVLMLDPPTHTEAHPRCDNPDCPCHSPEADEVYWEGDTGRMARIERASSYSSSRSMVAKSLVKSI